MVNHPNRRKPIWSVGIYHFGDTDFIGVYQTAEPFEITGSPGSGPPCICRMFGNGEEFADGTVARHAKLIAAAPDMLAALRRICLEVETPKDLLNAIRDAEALLRKTEG